MLKQLRNTQSALVLLSVLLMLASALPDHSWGEEVKSVYGIQKWQQDVAAYKAEMSQLPTATLWVRHAAHWASAVATCPMAVVMLGAVIAKDTVPVVNGLIAMGAQARSGESEFWSDAQLMEYGRGLLGGGAVAVLETLEFVYLWLAGLEEEAYQALTKQYEDSFRAGADLFSTNGQCVRHLSWVTLLMQEIESRRGEDTRINSLAIGAP